MVGARDRNQDGKAAAALLGLGQPALADPTLQVSVTGARLAPGGLQVVLTGHYVCGPFSPDSDGVVDLTVVQELGRSAPPATATYT